MTETLVTTAEEELRGLLGWLGVDPIDLEYGFKAHEGCDVVREEHVKIAQRISRRLDEIGNSHDGWRSRCLIAEKRNVELVDELTRVREELRDLKYANEGTETK